MRDALQTHPQMKSYAGVEGRDLAVSCRILTRPACQRIIRAAFDYARRFGYKSVTICEKPNVIRETSGMMEEEAKRIAAEYAGIALRSTNIDAQMMWLTKNPEDYGVLVASNMFGDILSDGFAGLVGGLGFAASANIGREVAVFEPTHGSAPKYAALTALDRQPHRHDPGGLHDARPRRPDRRRPTGSAGQSPGLWPRARPARMTCCGSRGGPDAIKQGAASTTQMTDAIIARL